MKRHERRYLQVGDRSITLNIHRKRTGLELLDVDLPGDLEIVHEARERLAEENRTYLRANITGGWAKAKIEAAVYRHIIGLTVLQRDESEWIEKIRQFLSDPKNIKQT